MKPKVKIFLAWPTTGQREDVHIYLLRDLQDRYGEYVEFKLPDICVQRLFHDHARNAMVEEFLASDCDVMWFLDSDVVPPTHILDLIAHNYDKWQCAGAPYPIYVPTHAGQLSICFTVYNGLTENHEGRAIRYAGEIPDEGTEFVDGLATGCLFIKREVFAKLSKPYFEFKFDNETRRLKEGEDLGFALKCADQGIKFFVDYGMVSKHFKRVCLLDMNNYSINLAKSKLVEYDNSTREALDTGLKVAYQAGIKKGIQQASQQSISLAPKKSSGSGLILPDHYNKI